MATYRVGQKCKLVNCENSPNRLFRGCNGDEVTILGQMVRWHYPVSKPASFPMPNDRCFVLPECLTPLTDPKADEFIARLEKLGHEPVIQPVEVER